MHRFQYALTVIYAGIDEAGYGPLLGPLCVGASAFRLSARADSALADPPDLWERFATGVARKPRDPKQRVAVADSKKLKSAGRQPLVHLERGVLAFAGLPGGDDPDSDDALFARLGVLAPVRPATPWHAHSLALPACHTRGEIALARARIARTLAAADAELAHFAATALDAPDFNALYRMLGNKAHVNLSLVFDAARQVDLLRGDEPAFLAIDRQGGRANYTGELERHVARGARVRTIREDEACSRYEVGEGLVVSFEVEAESRHLPVALASMAAKFVRERFMERLNAFFASRAPGLAPTAGYVEDGRRFLAEVKPILAAEGISEPEFARVV